MLAWLLLSPRKHTLPCPPRADDAQVDLNPGVLVKQDRLFVDQAGQLLLQFIVNVLGAVQEPGTRATGPVFVHCRRVASLILGWLVSPK